MPDGVLDSTGDRRCEKCRKAMELLALIERDEGNKRARAIRDANLEAVERGIL